MIPEFEEVAFSLKPGEFQKCFKQNTVIALFNYWDVNENLLLRDIWF